MAISDMINGVYATRMIPIFRIVFCSLALLTGLTPAKAQSIVVLVNDDPITSYDVAQRQRFLALTSGFGDKMRERLKSADTQEQFRQCMMKERPSTKEEAQALQKKFVEKLQQDVIASAGGSMRKQALDQLIEERLMLQAAKDQKIAVTDDEVNQMMTKMAEGGAKKLSLNEFLSQFSSQGVNPTTLKERLRAQTAWRQVIRRIYGSRIQSAVSTVETVSENDTDAVTVDVRVVSLTMPPKADQQAQAKRLLEAEQIRKRFSSCDKLEEMVKGVQGISIKPLKAAKLSEFKGEVKAALQKASAGQMTPPVISGSAVESHALCAKKQSVVAGKSVEKKTDTAADKTQEEFQLYAKRHLKDLKDQARLDYRKNG
jgi:peptidyl-prolyl cis-trans isomerase SurA